jgi:hypothetical protein
MCGDEKESSSNHPALKQQIPDVVTEIDVDFRLARFLVGAAQCVYRARQNAAERPWERHPSQKGAARTRVIVGMLIKHMDEALRSRHACLKSFEVQRRCFKLYSQAPGEFFYPEERGAKAIRTWKPACGSLSRIIAISGWRVWPIYK